MNKALLVLFCSCFVLSGAATVSDSLTLREVEVIGGERSYIEGRLVNSIAEADIVSLPAATLADVLQTLPSLDVRARGANGAQTDISLRGGTFDQVTVLLNGVCVNDAQTGHYAMNIPVPLSSIARIDVLQDAINIITVRPDSDTYYASMSLGMNMFAKVDAHGAWHRADWRITTAIDYTHNSGYYAPWPSGKEKTALNNSDFNGVNIYTSASYKGLLMQVGAQYKNAGAGSFYGFGSQDQFDATRTAFASATYAHRWGNWSLDALAAYRANYDRYEWHRGTVSNRHLTQNAAAAIRAHYTSLIGTTTLGAEVKNENIFSTNLGDSIKPWDGLTKGKNRLNVRYFAKQTFRVQRFYASLAAGGIYNTMFGHHWTADAEAGYAFPFGLTLFANAYRSVRMPTFTDLYYDAGNQLGSRDLKPEKMWTASLGVSFKRSFGKAGTLTAEADVYHRWGRDIIDWVYVAEDAKRPYHAANQQRVNTLGVECSVSYRWNQWLRLAQVGYAYTLLDIDLVESNSRYLDYLRHKLVIRVEHGIYEGLGASWTFSFRQRQGQFNDAEGIVRNYEPVCLLDGEIFYQYRHWRFAVECTNITNRHYYDYGGILQPGAWARVKILYHF